MQSSHLETTGFADIYIVFLPCGEEVRQGAEGGAAGGAGARGGEGGKEGGPTGLEEVDGKTDGTSVIVEGRRSVKKASLVEEFVLTFIQQVHSKH